MIDAKSLELWIIYPLCMNAFYIYLFIYLSAKYPPEIIINIVHLSDTIHLSFIRHNLTNRIMIEHPFVV
jgi:hypothetical protein